MSLNENMLPGTLFAFDRSGTGELSGSNAPATSVNAPTTHLQWRIRDLTLVRSGAEPVTVRILNRKRGGAQRNDIIISEIQSVLDGEIRMIPKNEEEWLFDRDTEAVFTTSGLGSTETWDLRVNGQIIGLEGP